MKKAIGVKKYKVPQEKPFCKYVHRVCTQTRLEGYDYCIRHILEDKSAPFRQCCFVQPQNKKCCNNAVPKNEKRERLCPWHSKQALMREKKTAPKKKESESPKTLLASLEQYCQDPLHDKNYDPVADQKEQMESMPVDMGIQSDLRSLGSSIDQTWQGDFASDEEDFDNEQDDPLRHAGVYTADEVCLITRDKLIKLQSLYIDQIKRLRHVLKEIRRDYVQAAEREKETLGSIESVPRQTPEDEVQYKKLKALMQYHKYYGKEALLHDQARERRRAVTEGSNYQPPHYPKCTFFENGQKCSGRSVPFSNFCLDHILKDPSQVLFKPCGSSEEDCSKPVVPYRKNITCLLHTKLPENENSENTWNRYDTSSSASSLPFQSMDDIASLGLDVVQPGSLFGLNQFGEPRESTDSALSGDDSDLMQMQAMSFKSI